MRYKGIRNFLLSNGTNDSLNELFDHEREGARTAVNCPNDVETI